MTVTNNYQTGGAGASPLTTQGDLYGHSASADARVPAGTDGQALVADSSQAAGVGYATRRALPPVNVGDWYTSAVRGWQNANAAGTLAAATLYLYPMEMPHAMTVDQLLINVATASTAGSARLGVYTYDTVADSGSLIADAGIVSTATTGNKVISSLAIPCPARQCWWALLLDQACSLGGFLGVVPIKALNGPNLFAHPRYLTATQTFGPLPANLSGCYAAAGTTIPNEACLWAHRSA